MEPGSIELTVLETIFSTLFFGEKSPGRTSHRIILVCGFNKFTWLRLIFPYGGRNKLDFIIASPFRTSSRYCSFFVVHPFK